MDIVKRLRAMDEEQFYQAPATSYRDCQEAADEIERLRDEVNRLRSTVTMSKLPTEAPLASRAFPSPLKL